MFDFPTGYKDMQAVDSAFAKAKVSKRQKAGRRKQRRPLPALPEG